MPYDKKKAQRVIDFISRYCTHTAGVWAGQPFQLIDWQLDFIHKFYGTVKEDGTRQYRFCYIEIPKKNGKTEIGGALALYHTCNDGENGAEVYGAAAEREQAGLVYKAAETMRNNSKTLTSRLTVLNSRKRIIDPMTNSYYQVLSSEAFSKHGLNPSAIIFDELHAQPNHELWDVLTSGTDYARSQQAIIVLTTAGVFDPESIWWKVRSHAIKVRDGIVEDPAFLPILYIADKDADVSDEEVWKKNNPALNQIFTIDKIRADYERIKDDPIEVNNFKRFRLNIPAASVSQWIMPDKWDKCSGTINEDDLKDRPCYAALDLSSTLDLTALVYVFPGDPHQVVCRFFIPEDNIRERVMRDRVPYDIWVEQGWIIPTPGNAVDHTFVCDLLMKDLEKFDIRELAFDRWGSAGVIGQLQDMGFEDEKKAYGERHLIAFGQGYASMSAPMKDLKRLIYEGAINHGDNPVLRWCANNVYAEVNAVDQIKPNKGKSTDRIDGIVALIMAIDRVMRHEETDEDAIGITVI